MKPIFRDAGVLARYSDGTPAVVCVQIGRGGIVLVRFHLCIEYSSRGPVKSACQCKALWELMRGVLERLRIHPIAGRDDLEVEVQERIYR